MSRSHVRWTPIGGEPMDVLRAHDMMRETFGSWGSFKDDHEDAKGIGDLTAARITPVSGGGTVFLRWQTNGITAINALCQPVHHTIFEQMGVMILRYANGYMVEVTG